SAARRSPAAPAPASSERAARATFETSPHPTLTEGRPVIGEGLPESPVPTPGWPSLFSGSGHPQAPGQRLPTGGPDELGVGGEVALPHPAWLHEQTPRPLHSQVPEPARSPAPVTGQHVEASAPAHQERNLQTCAVALQEHLLERRGHADEEHVGMALPDLLHHCRLLRGGEVAVAVSGQDQPGVLAPAGLAQLTHHLLSSAE